MAKGSSAKAEVFKKLMEVFPSSFMYNDGKELRINLKEDGELVQIKVSLTCAKVPVESGTDTAVPGEVKSAPAAAPGDFSFPDPVNESHPVTPTVENVAVSDQEKRDIEAMISELGL